MNDVERMIKAGVAQPTKQHVAMTFASPINDVQMLCLMAAIVRGPGESVEDAVQMAIKLLAEVMAQTGGSAISIAISEAQQRVTLRVTS